MGISSFLEFCSYLFNNKAERGLSEFRGNIAIVDGSHRLLKQCIGRINNREPITNEQGKMTIHLYVTFVTIIGMLDYGIQPFFVFEGKGDPSSDKNIICAERRRIKENARKKCDEIEDKNSAEYFKNLKKCFQLTNAHYDEVRHLLDLAGIPYVIAPGEGDPQCAALSKYYKIPVVTDDTDILAFGGARIWKDFSLAGKKTHELNKQTILEQMYVKANQIRSENNLSPIDEFSHSSFVDYCIMLGTDYTPDSCKTKISGISTTELFRLFVINDLDVEKMCEYINRELHGIKISVNFVQNWKHIKEKYLETPVKHPASINILMTRPRIDELVHFLCDENGLNREFVMGKIMGLEKDYRLFNDVYTGNANGQENDFGNFTSYRLKYSKQRLERGRHDNAEHARKKRETRYTELCSPLDSLVKIRLPTYLSVTV
jgi:flap endonuclease-1